MNLFRVSLSAANSFFTLSNIALIAGGVLVLVGTVGVFWFGGIREHYADQRTKEYEAKAAMAVADSARANESNTRLRLELEKERTERLRLEQRVAPRRLAADQRTRLISGLQAAGWREGEIMWHGTGEPEAYARDLASAFEAAGLKTHVHTPGPFLPSAWGLAIIETNNGVSDRLKTVFDDAGVTAEVWLSNETLGEKRQPTLLVGAREDQAPNAALHDSGF